MLTIGIDTSGRSPIECRDVPLRSGWTVRLAADRDAGALHLALGTGQGRDWREDPAAGGVSVPLDDAEGILAALEAFRRA